jgi:hypothetical protein
MKITNETLVLVALLLVFALLGNVKFRSGRTGFRS